MSKDNRIRADPEYIKLLRIKASLKGFNTLTSFTKSLVPSLKKELNIEGIKSNSTFSKFGLGDKNNAKKFNFRL